MLGPNQQFLVQTTKKQTIPKAISIQRSNLNKTSISSDGKKAMGLRAVKPLGIGAIRESLEEELTIDPKVMEPYEPIPGRVPRKVAIDRKKKEYASYNLEQLFAENVRARIRGLPQRGLSHTLIVRAAAIACSQHAHRSRCHHRPASSPN